MPRAPDSARVFDVELLYAAIDKKRRDGRLTWRLVAAAAGITASTFSRMALDSRCPDVENLCRLLLWLGDTDLKPYLRDVTHDD